MTSYLSKKTFRYGLHLVVIIAVLLLGSNTIDAQRPRPANYRQEHYWFLDDDNTINAASGYSTPDANQDTAIQSVSLNSKLRLRIAVVQTRNNPNQNLTVAPVLQYSTNGSNCSSGTWTTVPKSSSCGSNPICLTASTQFSDGTLTTQRFNDGHTFVGGDGVAVNGDGNAIVYANRNEHAEWEWMLNITNNATNNINYYLRIVDASQGALNDYQRCATLTTAEVSNSELLHYRWRNDDGGEVGTAQQLGTIYPDGDYSPSWQTVVPGGGYHFAAVNEGDPPNTSNYIATTNRSTEDFDLQTLTGGTSYTRVDVRINARNTGNDRIGVNLVVGGSDQSENTINLNHSFNWYTSSFTGLNMTQNQLDSLRLKLRHIRRGGTDQVQVASVEITVYGIPPGASFKQPEDTPVVDQNKNENVRVRFLVKNNSLTYSSPTSFVLHYAPRVGADCSGGDETYQPVPIQSSCSGSAVCMNVSTYVTNQEASQNISPGITDPSGSFTSGKLVEDPSNAATNQAMLPNQFTELEYVIIFTDDATSGESYCLRLSPIDVYTKTALITLSSAGGYVLNGTYVSNAFDAGAPSVFDSIEWTWSTTSPSCVTCQIRLQIQTAPDEGGIPGAWSPTWSGPEGEDGDETDYFTISTGELIHTDHNDDEWIRYRATMEGDGTDSPILEEVKINYQ
ncbi:hypothetical protein KC614_01245 [candidate division WWE3 bacterium]|uniref:Uncharacterized protein n=1 Tax=candidate division WWE3 bacterium TaxID=2053526 RepID=A0A955RRR2_UNCKA|nr:hypothetical protein [candidate division WWE3 bacterium]